MDRIDDWVSLVKRNEIETLLEAEKDRGKIAVFYVRQARNSQELWGDFIHNDLLLSG